MSFEKDQAENTARALEAAIKIGSEAVAKNHELTERLRRVRWYAQRAKLMLETGRPTQALVVIQTILKEVKDDKG